MLDQFCAGHRGYQEHGPGARGALRFVNRAVEPALEERFVNLAQLPLGSVILNPYDDAVRMEKVGDSGAFAEELRVGGHAKRSAVAAAIDPKSVT